jgi:hypothetical protein
MGTAYSEEERLRKKNKEMQVLSDLHVQSGLTIDVRIPDIISSNGFMIEIPGKLYEIHVCCPFDRLNMYAEMAVIRLDGDCHELVSGGHFGWDDDVFVVIDIDELIKEINKVVIRL